MLAQERSLFGTMIGLANQRGVLSYEEGAAVDPLILQSIKGGVPCVVWLLQRRERTLWVPSSDKIGSLELDPSGVVPTVLSPTYSLDLI